MTAFHETPEFLRGREAELRIAGLLQRDGWYILPACQYSGRANDQAPTLQGADDRIVLPDLVVARKGILRAAEVKAKWDANFHYSTGTFVHGIGRRLCRHYLRCQEETGAHVWLFILEEKSQVLCWQSLDELRKSENVHHVYEGELMDRGGMVFWSREVFHRRNISELPALFDLSMPFTFDPESVQ